MKRLKRSSGTRVGSQARSESAARSKTDAPSQSPGQAKIFTISHGLSQNQAKAKALGSGLENVNPRPRKARPKAKPAHHYLKVNLLFISSPPKTHNHDRYFICRQNLLHMVRHNRDIRNIYIYHTSFFFLHLLSIIACHM